jgi:hypothetical protein
MTEIANWRAARSGASITIHGENADTGERVKIPNVVLIQPAPAIGGSLATTRDGATLQLLAVNPRTQLEEARTALRNAACDLKVAGAAFARDRNMSDSAEAYAAADRATMVLSATSPPKGGSSVKPPFPAAPTPSVI